MNGIHGPHIGAALLTLAAAVPTEAGIVIGDKEWLSLRDNYFYSYNEVVSELGPGGLFEGYMVADYEDLIDLAVEVGILDDPTDSTTDFAATEALTNLFGDVFSDSEGTFVVLGGNYLDYETSDVGLFYFITEYVLEGPPPFDTPSTSYILHFPGPLPEDLLDFADPVDGGTWLFRPAATGVIPEPPSASAWLLLGVVVISVGRTCCKRAPGASSNSSASAFAE